MTLRSTHINILSYVYGHFLLKHFICIVDTQATLFILPLCIRSFRLAKWERKGMDGERKRGGEEEKEVEGREEERGRSRLGDPS